MKTKLAYRPLTWLLGALVCTAMSDLCYGQHSQTKTQDSWFREPRTHSEYLHLNGGKVLDESRIFEVQTNYEAEAEAMLTPSPVHEITVEAAKRMVGKSFSMKDGCIPFLARGLYTSKGTGAWRIYELGDKLQVGFFSTGTKAQAAHRQALVLLLKRKPVEVYAFCGVTQ